MATKPTNTAAWNNDGTNNVEPSSGQKDTGWTLGQKPPSSYFNWWMKLVHDWMQYLSDGALSGDHSIAGNLSVTGTSGVTGNATVGGTLGVTGITTATGRINANGGITASGTVDLTAATLKMPSKKAFFSAAGLGYLYSGTASQAGNYWTGGTVGQVHIPIFVPVGERITTVKVYFQRASTSIVFQLDSYTYGSSSTSGAGIANLTANSGNATVSTDTNLSMGTINHTVVADRQYVLQASIGSASDRFYGIEVTWDKVA